MKQSNQLIIETLQVNKRREGRMITTSRFTRKTVFTKHNGEQFVLYMGKRILLHPHPLLRIPTCVISQQLP
jgi:hypothetical protein